MVKWNEGVSNVLHTKETTEKMLLTTEIVSLFPLQGHWTEEDYFNLPETNTLVELSNGRIIFPHISDEILDELNLDRKKLEEVNRPAIEIACIFPRQGEWTESEYLLLSDITNHIIELTNGRLIIPEMPTDYHQNVLGNLFVAIYLFVKSKGLGQVRTSALPVFLWEGYYREPDIVFMSKEHNNRISRDYWGIPDMAVEVISKNSVKDDRVDKFTEYAQAGIAEYWIIDPIKQTIEVFTLEQGDYILLGKWSIGEIARSKVLEGFEIKVDSVMEK
jgi:Uma2 family endonuclease